MQLGMLNRLLDRKYHPDITLGTSGGAVAAYIALAADWDPCGISRIARNMYSGMFVGSWWPASLSFLPSWMVGFFMGSTYNNGKGENEFFDQLFNHHTITRDEIWVGTANRTHGKAELFCNQSRKQSQIKVNSFSPASTGCLPLSFMDGDVPLISSVVKASASIPTIVPEQPIGKDLYVDGGVYFASPLTPMADSIGELEDEGGLHLVYISSFDLQTNQKNKDNPTNLVKVSSLTFDEMIRGICIQDRLSAERLISSFNEGKKLHFTEGKGNSSAFDEALKISKNSSCSMLELYPSNDLKSLDPTEFDGNNVVSLMEATECNYYFRLWYKH